MTSEIIDQASALEEMVRDHAIQAHRLNHSAVSATHCEECGETKFLSVDMRFRDVRSALVVRKMKKSGIGGCDGKNDFRC